MSEVSDPDVWMSLHYVGRESSDSEEWTRRERRGEEPMVEPTPEGEAVLEDVNNHYNAFNDVETYGDGLEPEGEPRSLVARTRWGRNPVTYPGLTREETNGSQYPGVDVDLSQFSDKERMMRLLECIQASQQ